MAGSLYAAFGGCGLKYPLTARLPKKPPTDCAAEGHAVGTRYAVYATKSCSG
jgi:hypothetical protein